MVVLERDGSLVRNSKGTQRATESARKRKARPSGWLGRFFGSMRRQPSEPTTIYR